MMDGRRSLLVPLAAFAAGGLCGWGACLCQASRPVQAVCLVEGVRTRERPSVQPEASDTRADYAVAVEPVVEPAVTDPARIEDLRRQAAADATVEPVVDGETGLPMDQAREKFLRDHPAAAAAQQTRLLTELAARRLAAEDRRRVFDAVEAGFLSPEQQARHETFRADLARRDELQAKADELRLSHGRLPSAESKELMRLGERLRSGAEAERDALLEAAARSAGFEGRAAGDFAETIKTIYEVTRPQNYR